MLAVPMLLFGTLGVILAAAGAIDAFARTPTLDIKFIRVGTIGIVFVIVSLSLLCKRSGMVINRRHTTVVSWSRFIWIRDRSEYRLAQFNGIALIKYWNTDRQGHEWLYRIVLQSRTSDTEPLKLGDELDEHRARSNFQQLAKFLRMPATEFDEDE